MSETPTVSVMRLKDRPGKFVVLAPDSEAYNLSPNYGELTEQEVREVLTCNYGKAPAEIEALVRQANQNPEFPFNLGLTIS
jgi:hypothetical protein